MIHRVLFIACLLTAAVDLPVNAQEKQGKSTEIPLVVTGQMTAEPRQSVMYPVRVITREQIDARGAVTLRDLIDQSSGIGVGVRTVLGTGVGMGGFGTQHIQILRDGVEVIGRLDGVLDLQQITLSGVDRVEVLFGPASVNYGTNAMGGAINLISSRPEARDLGAELIGRVVDEGDHLAELRADYAIDRYYVGADVRTRLVDGSGGHGRDFDWNRRAQEDGGLRMGAVLGSWMLDLRSRGFHEDQRDQSAADDTLTAEDITYTTRRWQQSLRLKGSFGRRHNLDVQLSYSDFTREESVDTVDLSTGRRTEKAAPTNINGFDQTTLRAFWHGRSDSGRLGWQTGIHLKREHSDNILLTDGNRRNDEEAIFAAMRWIPMKHLTVQPSIRLGNHDDFDVPVSPALQVKYDGGFGVWKTSYRRGYQAPTLEQRYLDATTSVGADTYRIIGNPNLEAEEGESIRLSWSGRVRDTGLVGLIYRNRLTHRISQSAWLEDPQALSRYTSTYLNIDEHEARGLLLGANRSWNQFRAGLELTVLAQSEALDHHPGVADFNSAVDGIMRLTWLPVSPFRLDLNYKYNGSERDYAVFTDPHTDFEEVRELKLEDYHQLDLIAGYSWLNDSMHLQVGARNLFDVTNLESAEVQSGTLYNTYLTDIGRSFYLQLGFRR
ncbi:MAG: TonB-dependent receptor [Acidobacteriota bacterium]|nr:TonB-dependent receptor [Acidobacteriota bacterium]